MRALAQSVRGRVVPIRAAVARSESTWAPLTGEILPGSKRCPPIVLPTRTVLEEITHWTHYHGTRADLRTGDLIEPGHAANFGARPRSANFVYFARTVDAAAWGAELAAGDSRGRIYVVEPTGEFEDDPNVTNMKFKGNPTKSFCSRAPLRVIGELEEWTGHPPRSDPCNEGGDRTTPSATASSRTTSDRGKFALTCSIPHAPRSPVQLSCYRFVGEL